MNIKKLKAIEELLKQKKETKPDKGYHDRSYWQKEFRLSEKGANAKIRELLDYGMMTTKMFKTRTGLVVRPVPHYKLTIK